MAPAIAAAAPGDVIRVRRGVYREDLVVDKRLTLIGENWPVLVGGGSGTVVTFTADGCELRGFVIQDTGAGETNEMDAAVRAASNNNTIAGNRMRHVYYGVVVSDARGNRVIDNEITGFAAQPFGRRGDGVYCYRAPNTLVARNTIEGERDAIYFQYAPGGRAVGNTVVSSRYGLHDMFSDDATIADNVFRGCAVGANIMNSRRIAVERNRFESSHGIPGIGLTLKDCDGSSVVGNAVVANPRGLLLDGASHNRFADNVFAGNDTAVLLFSSAERNRFGGNAFRDNWSDLVLSGRDSGTEWTIDGRGNYWSRYRGFDFDGDGIGDSSHGALGAFERIEGANAAARIFLQSPAAAGLELAARLSGRPGEDAVDTRPLVAAPADRSATAAGAAVPSGSHVPAAAADRSAGPSAVPTGATGARAPASRPAMPVRPWMFGVAIAIGAFAVREAARADAA